MTAGQRFEDQSTMRPGDAPRSLWVGLVVGLLAFVLELTFSSTRTVNGAMVECSYFDAGALIAAGVCLLCGILAITSTLRRPHHFPMHAGVVLGVSGFVLLLAVVHVLRAFGIVGGIC